MDFTDLQGWAQATKAAIDAFKAGRDMLPKGPERDTVDQKIAVAEDIIQRADAQLALKLGYQLHRCTFPPQIMLRDEKLKAWVCRNPECGHIAKDRIVRTPREAAWLGRV